MGWKIFGDIWKIFGVRVKTQSCNETDEWSWRIRMTRLARICPQGIPLHIIQRGNNGQACFEAMGSNPIGRHGESYFIFADPASFFSCSSKSNKAGSILCAGKGDVNPSPDDGKSDSCTSAII